MGWPELAALGLVGVCAAEEAGGFGFRVDAAVAVAEELGGALHGSPYAGLCASAAVLSRTPEPAAAQVLEGLLTGERICTFAELTGSTPIARLVDGAHAADALVVADPSAGCFWLCVERAGWTVGAEPPLFDVSRRSAEVRIDTGRAVRLAARDDAFVLRRLLLCADALGGLQRMLTRTVGYAAQRQSFGRPIGGLQSVQHRLVDHSLRARGMALLVADAAKALTAGSADADRLVTLAELSVSASPAILHDLVQLTGAIGFTWEYGLHHYQRRVHQDARLGSNPRGAVRRLAGLEGWTRVH